MITAVTPFSTAPAAATRPTAPQAAPAQAAPTESVDLSMIDTPAKAAALPILDASVQLGLAAGIAAAVMAGMGGGSAPLISLDIATKTAGQESSMQIVIDPKNETDPVTSTGTFAGQPVSGGLKMDPANEQVSWIGKIGNNAEELHFAGLDQDAQSLKLNVKLGSIEGTVNFSPLKGDAGPDDYQGYRIQGELGGQPYQVDTIIDIPESLKRKEPPADGRVETTMTSKGFLGSETIQKDYQIVGQMTSGGVVVEVTGAGTAAGIPQEIQAVLTVAP